MELNRVDEPRPPASAGVLVTLAVTLGPLLSVWWTAAQADRWGPANAVAAAWVAWALWGPWAPCTMAAVLLGDHRDRATPPGSSWWLRGVLLVPWLACSGRSTARAATWGNLIALVVAAGWLVGL